VSQTALIFLLLYFTGLTLALTVRPMYGLYTYVAEFYVHPPSRWWGLDLPDLRWSLLAAAVTLIAILRHKTTMQGREPWYRSTIARVLILYALWMWIQLPWVLSPYQLTGTILLSKYVLLFFLVYTLVDNEEDLYGFCLAHVLGCAYLGWLIYAAADSGRLESVGGPGIDNANALGMHLVTGLMFAGFLMLVRDGWRRWAIVAAIPFILNGIVQTETRGAVIGLLVGGLATVYLKPKRFRRIYYVLVISAVIGVIAVANEAFIARMSTVTGALAGEAEWDNSARSRVETVKAQLRMFAAHPLGAGHQGTAVLSPAYIGEEWLAETGTRDSHNTVMTIVVDQGVPGIVLLVCLGFAVAGMLRRMKKLDADGLPGRLGLYRALLGGALLSVVSSGMFAQNLKAEVQIWCLVLLAALWQLVTKTKLENEPNPTPERSSVSPAPKMARVAQRGLRTELQEPASSGAGRSTNRKPPFELNHLE
jgi:hypothetical protein